MVSSVQSEKYSKYKLLWKLEVVLAILFFNCIGFSIQNLTSCWCLQVFQKNFIKIKAVVVPIIRYCNIAEFLKFLSIILGIKHLLVMVIKNESIFHLKFQWPRGTW